MVTVLIPCAGKGVRMGGEIPKQYQKLAGIPLFVHTLLVFERHPECDNLILAIDPAFEDFVKSALEKYQIKKVRALAKGGKTRQESVYQAMLKAKEETELFLVHDAVRPFVSEELISAIIEETRLSGAAIPVIPVRDALVRGREGYLEAPLSREGLYLVQTPQAVKASLLKETLERAIKEGLDFPDESSLLHYYGYSVKLLQGSVLNIKITYPEDFLLAERLLSK